MLISAPAGFGKTTLLVEWIRRNKPQVSTAWYSLDEGDNDPVRFWDYFIAALQTLQPGCGEKILPLLHSSQPPSTELILNTLINELSSIAGDFVVVLDDYHLIESQQIHDGITYLLEHMPVQMHLAIATRADPPLPLARFRGRGALLEIRTDDLRFTLDDTTSLLQELKTPEISALDVAALNERTEGWAVGLKMAALSMRGQKDIPRFITAFSGSQRYVIDYLMEEVLNKQLEDVQEFLLKTSVLERLTAPLCDTVTGRKDSQDILLKLEHDNLFIVPIEESRQWYRYEHLFTDLLRHQCESAYGTERVFDLHKQASQWYEDNNLPDEAIHHALAARDWESAMRLIYAHGEYRRKRGEFNTLLGWFEAIPQEVLCKNYRLYSLYAAVLSSIGQFDTAEAALKYLESTARDDNVLQGEVAFSLASFHRRRGDIKRFIELSEKALSLLPPDNVAMRSRATFNIGYSRLFYGPFQEAKKWLTEAYELAQQAGDTWVASGALSYIGSIAVYEGKLHQAVETYKRAIEIAGQTPPAGPVQNFLCQALYELNDLEAAAENARLAFQWGEFGGQMEAAMSSCFFQAQIRLARGDVAGAAASMDKMDRASRHPTVTPNWVARHAACRVLYAIRLDNLEEASRWGRQLPGLDGLLNNDQHVPARLLIAQGEKEAAARLLRELYDSFTRFGVLILALRVRVYQALAAPTPEEALTFLSEALIKGETMGCIRIFVDEGKLLKPLLEKALSKGITPVYTKKLLSIIEAEERQNLKVKRSGSTPSSTQSVISERELEVLRLMAEGLSNQQIADRLFISLSTAKNHVHNILEKLNVQGRTQAIAQARELKLL